MGVQKRSHCTLCLHSETTHFIHSFKTPSPGSQELCDPKYRQASRWENWFSAPYGASHTPERDLGDQGCTIDDPVNVPGRAASTWETGGPRSLSGRAAEVWWSELPETAGGTEAPCGAERSRGHSLGSLLQQTLLEKQGTNSSVCFPSMQQMPWSWAWGPSDAPEMVPALGGARSGRALRARARTGASGTRPGCHPSGVGLPRVAQEGEQCGQICILESSPGQCVGETTGISPGKGHGVDAQGLTCVVGTQSEEGRLQCTWWARSQSPVIQGRWTHRWILFSPSRALKIRKAGALCASFCRRGLLPEGPHRAGASAAPRRRGEERGGWRRPIPSSVYTSTQCRGLSSRTTHRSARPGGPLPVTGGEAHSHQLAYGIARACPLQWLHVPPGAQPQGFAQEEWDTALWQTGRVDAAPPWGGSQKRGPLSLALKNE